MEKRCLIEMMLLQTIFFILLTICSSSYALNGDKTVDSTADDQWDPHSANLSACPATMFPCRDGRCIPLSWLCDRDNDCVEGEDEDAKNCSPGCLAEEFKCASDAATNIDHVPKMLLSLFDGLKPRCIPSRWRCDGEYDCADRSDEVDCPKFNCTTDQHECGPYAGVTSIKICVPISWRCDGQNDCADRSDEQNCTDAAVHNERICAPEEFRCDNGACIFEQWKCDGDNDCLDASDEKNCTHQCQPDQFTCKNNQFCIPKNWRCDGEKDCIDGSDESECHEIPPSNIVHCREWEFKCRTGNHCINKMWLCDDDDDCPDASDEDIVSCPDKKQECAAGDHRCVSDNKCIISHLLCDGTNDCADGSDEANCPPKAPKQVPCLASDFSCGSGYCIPYSKVCDQKSDCPNAADENATLCSSTTAGTCDQDSSSSCRCRPTTGNGRVCTCDDGYAADSTRKCADIDECATHGICDQLCINEPGGYRCACHRGYALTINTEPTPQHAHHCRAIGHDPILLVANRATIRQVDLVTNAYQPLISKLDSAVAMDFIMRNNTLVWSDVAQEKIMICHLGNATRLNSTSQCAENADLILVSDNVTTPDGLAIDWVHGLLYWTDTGRDTISVIDLNTRMRRTLFSEGLDEPRAIAVDPAVGVIFWSDWGEKACIERASMDGTDRQIIVQDEFIRWPNGLAIDMLDQRIYWADAKLKTITSCDYWGNDKRIVLQSWQTLRHPFSLSLFEERLYWTDWDHEGVLMANKFTGEDLQTVVQGISGPMTVRVYHEMAQPMSENKCDRNTCDQLCLPRSHLPLTAPAASDVKVLDPTKSKRDIRRAYACVCSDGFNRDTNSNRCLPNVAVTKPTQTPTKKATKKPAHIEDDDDSKADVATSTESNESPGYKPAEPMDSRHPFALSTTFLIFTIATAILLVGYVFWRRRSIPLVSLNFDNPVYRRTVEDGDSDNDAFVDHYTTDHPATHGRVKLALHGGGGAGGTDRYQPITKVAPPTTIGDYMSESLTEPLTTSMVA